MKDLLDKLSNYNLFNYLLPGLLYAALVDKISTLSIAHENLLLALVLYYFAGLVISRIGTLVLEPLFKRTGFVRFAPYKDYVAASLKHPKLELLSESNNMYRTLCATFLSLGATAVVDGLRLAYQWPEAVSEFLLISGLITLFAFSYRKQTAYVKARVEAIKAGADSEPRITIGE